jgi:hypothetical protein
MRTEHIEAEILQEALAKLRENTGLRVDAQHTFHGHDARITIGLQDVEWHFAAEVKKTLTRATLGFVTPQLRDYLTNVLLVTRYVTPQIAETLREMNIPFIDTAGNAYINEPPLLILIKGNRPARTFAKGRTTRAFAPTGLQVVYTLLCNPVLEEAPFRKIAERAKVALGTVGWVMRDLKEMGYLVDMGRRGRRLVRKKKLLERWVTEYPQQLRRKNFIGRYRVADPDWWKDANLRNLQAFWGGEVAANKLTKYLKPQDITIYAIKPVNKLILKNKMQKDPKGNIELLEVFWRTMRQQDMFRRTEPYPEEPDLVHPILIYADLMATGDPRNIETAEIIYERELDRFIRED